jgi:hypothetical protein
VVLLLVCAFRIVGAPPQIVSATRMAIRILRENINSFLNFDYLERPHRLEWRERCHRSASENISPDDAAVRLEYTWWLRIFPRSERLQPDHRIHMAELEAHHLQALPRQHNFLREGVITGFIGATAIALWFLTVDTIAGHPFYTPIFLGKGVVSVLGKNMMGDTAFTHVLSYTIFHYAAFVVVGIVLTVIVHQAERTPAILAGLLVAFVMMTLGFYMIAAAFASSALGNLAWPQIFIANLLASGLMLGYLWRTHPKLNRQLKQALEGNDD